jgi:3-hydroxyisobutyrate dehydrogenase-like beta-hydroxyacid dehydrogenase
VNIGFIGLGIMGRPMAASLLKAGHALFAHDHKPVPEGRIELHQKDLALALASAAQIGVALPSTATAQQLFNACAAHGGAAWDHAALVRALERLADHEIGSEVGGAG